MYKVAFKVLFLLAFYACIRLSDECRKASRSRSIINVSNNQNRVFFSPSLNITLPGNKIQQQVSCEGDCDKDAFQFIYCEGDYKTTYTCELIDSIVGYQLENYKVTCAENLPINNDNCYVSITLNRTDLVWLFDSRVKLANPLAPDDEVDQVVCVDSYCEQMEYTLVECTGK